MSARLMRFVLALAAVTAGVTVAAQTQRNGEATSSTPTVERVPYDTRVFMAPLMLTEAQLKGRRIVAQRCANCHAGNPRQPGPPLGRQIVENRGEAFIRDKVKNGSTLMPGFQYTLQPDQIDDIIAFLKTYSPPARSPAAPED
ncbi:MAG TPA: cytochrome c [Vicinamibacterales bacterium]|jgi:mono/diheme cytochrome c family protein